MRLSAQFSPYYKQFVLEDGLPGNELYWVQQSIDGRILLGSDVGLVVFDGINFQRYTNSKARNDCFSYILNDSLGGVWGINFAYQLFQFKEDSLLLISRLDTQKYIKRIHAIDIQEGNELSLSMHGNKRYIKYIPNQDSLFYGSICAENLVSNLVNLGGNRTATLGWNEKQNVYGIYICKEANLDIFYACPDCKSYQGNIGSNRIFVRQSASRVYAFVHYNKNTTSKEEKPYLFLLQDSILKPFFFPENIKSKINNNLKVNQVRWQNDSTVWMATSQGLIQWNIADNTGDCYLNEYAFSSVLVDYEANIWGATIVDGLFFIPSISAEVFKPTSFTGNLNIIDTEVDAYGNILVAFNRNRLGYISGDTRKIIWEYTFETDHKIDLLGYDSIEHKFWIDRSKVNQVILDPKTLKITQLPWLSAVKEFEFDKQGNLIIITGLGAFIFNKKKINKGSVNIPQWKISDTITDVNHQLKHSHLSHSLSNKKIKLFPYLDRAYSLANLEGPGYTVWVGFSTGLYAYNSNGRQEIRNIDSSKIIARDLVLGKDSTLWVATSNSGLLKVEKNKVSNALEGQRINLATSINKILVSDEGVWMATKKGLLFLNFETQELINCTRINGLPLKEVRNLVQTKDRIYFSYKNSLNSILKSAVKKRPGKPMLSITNFWSNDSLLNKKEPIILKHNENAIKIGFRAISMFSNGAFSYFYRLVGVDQNWVQLGSERNTVRYPRLTNGTYLFQVKAVDVQGISSGVTELDFIITPPFYKKTGFLAIILGFGCLLFFFMIRGIYRVQLSKIEAANRKKDEENKLALERAQLESNLRQEQLKAIKAQMNPHFIFNVLNCIQGLYLINDKEEANQLLSQFSILIRSVLEMSEELEVSLDREIELLKLYLNVEHMRVRGAFDYEIKVKPELDQELYFFPSMLIQPYVENAIKHGLLHKSGAKKIQIEFKFLPKEGVIQVCIDDNGIGREASRTIQAKAHKSFSILANKKRLELLNEGKVSHIGVEFVDKKDERNNPIGTLVILRIPVIIDE